MLKYSEDTVHRDLEQSRSLCTVSLILIPNMYLNIKKYKKITNTPYNLFGIAPCGPDRGKGK